MSESEFSKGEKKDIIQPTDGELLTMLERSNISGYYKKQLKQNFERDPWIKRQLEKIHWEIDRVYNTAEKNPLTINLLWGALNTDWAKRNKLPLGERK